MIEEKLTKSDFGRYDRWYEIPVIECYWCHQLTNNLVGHVIICLARPKGDVNGL